LERLPKESYAEALREQIAGHAARGGTAGQREPAPEQDPFVGSAAAAKRATPSAAQEKDARQVYASALREQIALRDAHRAADGARGRLASPMQALGCDASLADSAGAPPRGKRCLPPPMPSRESYAAALEEQIAAREATRQANASSPPMATPGPSAVMLSEPEKATGRRMVGPVDSHDKGAYASELREQMLVRSMRSAADRAASQEPPHGGLEAVLTGADWQLRGKRQAMQMPATSKESYTQALQEQMADREAQRAAKAFHLQAPDSAALPPERLTKGKRQAASSEPPPSREAYAAALQDQMKEHRMRRAAQLAEDFTSGGSVFGGAAIREASPAARGRRHSSHIELPSKQALGSALREQMAERPAPRAGGSLEHHQDQTAGLPPRAPSSCSRPLEATYDPAMQEPARRQQEALETTAVPAEGSAPGGGREALNASTRLGRSGACVIANATAGGAGFSTTEARRIRFADECTGAADGNERTLAAREVDERAEELRRLLDDGGARPGLPVYP